MITIESPPRPARPPAPKIENIPSELKLLNQWVLWRYEFRGDTWTKIPYQPLKPRVKAKADDSTTWGSFDRTWEAYQKSDFDGIGFEFSANDEFFGVDFDKCLDDGGMVLEWAAPILSRLQTTYGEISPSGRGIKFFARGKLPGETGTKRTGMGDGTGALELYDHGRFFTVTGDRFGDGIILNDLQEAADQLYKLAKERPNSVASQTRSKSNGTAKHWVQTALNGADIEARVIAYLATIEPAVSGQGGHHKTFGVACRVGPGFNLTEDEAYRYLRDYFNPRCEPPWSEHDLRRKVSEGFKVEPRRGWLLDSGKQLNGHKHSASGAPSSNGVHHAGGSTLFAFSNCKPDIDTSGKVIGHSPRAAKDMASYLKQSTDGWPKRVGEILFVKGADNGPIFLESATQLFGALDGVASVFWMKGSRLISQERFFEYLRKFGAERFEVIETAPHCPPMRGAFYIHPSLACTGATTNLDRLLKFFKPATDLDKDLILAAIATLFWGGPPGARPAFRIEGPENDPDMGRGAGKTTLATTIAALAGGHVRLEEGEEFSSFITRLLSNEHGHKRVALVDNVKKARMSWAPLEEFITSPVISGHALFRGEGQRPNTMTVLITVNGGTLSKDLTQRVIPIRLARPTYRPTWDTELAEFIDKHRWDLIGEIIDWLAADRAIITAKTRWASWEQEILARCDNVYKCQEIIKARTELIDDDDNDAFEFEQFVAEKLQHERKHNPDTEVIKIPTATIAEWLTLHEHGPRGKPIKPNTATALLGAKPLKRLEHKRTNSERFWIWWGNPNSDCVGGKIEPVALKDKPVWTATATG